MRLNPFERVTATLPFMIGTFAVAGIVHIGTVLAYPDLVEDNAFARVAALAPVGAKTTVQTAGTPPLPFMDAAMAVAVCRFDLAQSAFRISVPALESGFVSFGMHDRRGAPYYGLNLQAEGGSATTLVMATGAQKSAEANPDHDATGDLMITSPDQGFVLIETPLESRALLDDIGCGAPEAAPH